MDKRERVGYLASAAIVLALFVLASYIAQTYQPAIESVVGKNSYLGMGAFVFLFILSVIFTPITTIPLIPVGSQLWGVWITTALSVIGWTMGAVIAFILARGFGMPFVSRFLSLKKIEQIEKMIPEENIFWTLFFFRAVMPFDGLSYTLGLFTKVNFQTFFWATLLGLIPFCLVMAYLGSLPLVFLIIGLVLASAFFVAGVLRFWKKANRKR